TFAVPATLCVAHARLHTDMCCAEFGACENCSSNRRLSSFIETKLLGMYSKCGSLQEAYEMFDQMRRRDLFAWSAMIGACSRDSRWSEVMELFNMMMGEGVVPDDFLFPKILQACANCGDVETGMLIHSIAIRCGMSSEIV
ncbi:Pentatricopeptide repeat-containing protein, partial [Datura stramonium]|nr:Pentatricopeptide repeat-containing protein [Datura stramonium]